MDGRGVHDIPSLRSDWQLMADKRGRASCLNLCCPERLPILSWTVHEHLHSTEWTDSVAFKNELMKLGWKSDDGRLGIIGGEGMEARFDKIHYVHARNSQTIAN